VSLKLIWLPYGKEESQKPRICEIDFGTLNYPSGENFIVRRQDIYYSAGLEQGYPALYGGLRDPNCVGYGSIV